MQSSTPLAHIFFIISHPAFANVGNGKITIENSALLKRFVAAAHGGNTLAVLSVGGWGQSGGFSDAVVSDSARNTLATSIATVIKSYNLDGIDLDWECEFVVASNLDLTFVYY